MRKAAIALALALASLAPPLAARVSHHYAHPAPPATLDVYMNSTGHAVHRPMQSPLRPKGATAHCRDGSWSFSEHRRGTCSYHGGVAEWL